MGDWVADGSAAGEGSPTSGGGNPGGETGDEGTSAEGTYDVVWPKAPMGVQARRSAPRLDSLSGVTVAFLWDYLFRGDELFPVLEKQLVERFPDIEIIGYEEFGNTHGSDEVERIAGLSGFLADRHVDAVVSGMGC